MLYIFCHNKKIYMKNTNVDRGDLCLPIINAYTLEV